MAGRVFSDNAARKGNAKTLVGEELRFSKSDDGLSVNGAAIVKTDIDTSNGVIHVIDQVLLPKG